MKTLLPYSILLASMMLAGCEGNPSVTPPVQAPFDNTIPWQKVGGIQGGNIQALLVSGGAIFAGTGAGIFVSTNSGINWSPAINGIPDGTSIIQITSHGDSVFAVASTRICFSTTMGASWSEIQPPPGYLNSLAVTDSGILAATNNGLFRLVDSAGGVWNSVGPPRMPVTQILVAGNVACAAASDFGFLRSTDGGTTWSIVNSGLGNAYLYALGVVGRTILAGTNQGLYSLAAGSSEWVSTGINTYVNKLATDGRQVLAGGGGTCSLSTNGGVSWKSVGPPNSYINIQAVGLNGDLIILGTDDGAYVSTDGGTSWSSANAGLINTQTTSLRSAGQNLLAGVPNKGIFISTDRASTWVQTNISNGYAYDFIEVGEYVFAATSNGVLRSTDGGKTWVPVPSFGLSDSFISRLLSDGMYLYASSYSNIYVSENLGDTWTNRTPGAGNRYAAVLAFDGEYVFVQAADSLYRSSDRGATWHALGSVGGNPYISALGVSRSMLIAATFGGFSFSNDHGSTWIDDNAAYAQNNNVYEFMVVGGRIFARTYYEVLVSRDNGFSWNLTGMQKAGITGMTYDGTSIYVATSSAGIWKHDL